MILIHTALQSEAQSIIEYYKLKKDTSMDIKVYSSENILLVISGMGKENTKNALIKIFAKFNILKALNIGIAGCNNNTYNIGDIFCTNRKLEDINYMQLKTVDKAQSYNNTDLVTLYDMEAHYFEEICLKFLDTKIIYIF
jgi:purine-nucleoside phosphorylase